MGGTVVHHKVYGIPQTWWNLKATDTNISMGNSKIKVSGNVKILFIEITYELCYRAGLLLKVGLH